VELTQIDTHRCIIGEGPVWDVAEQALYFIDILVKRCCDSTLRAARRGYGLCPM
jgi:sugar lactone lactonase YvrE